jgi:hypothetical protein
VRYCHDPDGRAANQYQLTLGWSLNIVKNFTIFQVSMGESERVADQCQIVPWNQ